MILHKRFTKRIALLAASTVMCMNISVLEAKDYKGHWAQEAISKWVSLGIIKGYEDETIRPSKPVTRAELASFLSRIFQLTYKDTSINYKDVKEGTWYHEAVTLVMSAELMNDYEGEFRPNQMATREEAAYAFAHAYHLAGGDAKIFVDSDLISDWAKEEVEALIAGGYLQGRTDGTLAPKDTLTRAEFITMLDKLTAKLYQDPGTYSGNISGNVVINTADITLKDMTISGNLYIAEGVGEGDVTLDNVKVEGVMIVEGGGEHSVEVMKSTLGSIYVDKASGSVRVALDESSKAAKVKVNSKARLEGSIEYVEVVTKEEINLVGATIKNLQISASDGNIKVDKTSAIDELVAEVRASIIGSGKVNKAFINADGVIIEGLKLSKDAVVIGNDVKVSPIINTTSGQISGGGGGGGSTAGSGNNGSTDSDKNESTGSGDSEKPGDLIEVSSIHIIGPSQVKVGSSIKLIADVKTTGDDESLKQVTWSIGAGSLQDVKITQEGIFTAGSTTGTAIIVATSKQDPAKYVEHKIEIISEDEYIPVEGITLNHSQAELTIGEGVQLLADVSPSHATNKQVMWSSSNEKSVMVDQTGYMIAISEGDAVITATTLDGEYVGICHVTVKKNEQKPVVSGIKIQGETTVEVGESIVLSAEVNVLPDVAQYKEVTWQVKEGSAEGAVISEKGILTAGNITGTVIVVATSKEDTSQYAEYYVTIVKKVPVESIQLSHENLEMLLGDEAFLTAQVFPLDATNKKVTWISNNPDIVSVDDNGKITTHGIGEAEITVSTPNGEISTKCAIKVKGRTLSGKVTVEDNSIEGTKISLYSDKDNFNVAIASVEANASGEYEFSNLPKGNYRIKAFYEDEISEYIAPVSEVSMEEAFKKVDINCEKVTSFTVKAVDSVTNKEILYVNILVEGQDEEGNKWSYKKETDGAGQAKFTLPNDIDSQVTYTLKKDGYEEITLNYNLKLLEKNTLVVPFKKEVEPIYPEKIEQHSEREGTNLLGVGDTTYEALKSAGWRVESETKLSTNSRRLIFENMNGEGGIDAKIIYNRSGFGDEIKDYDVLLQYMIRKQTEDTKGDWLFEELKQNIQNGSGVHIDGHRTIKVTYDGKVDGIVEIVFSNYN